MPAEIKADEYNNYIEDLLNILKAKMSAAQAKYQDNTDRNRLFTLILNVKDEVWLNAYNIRIKRPSRKLD